MIELALLLEHSVAGVAEAAFKHRGTLSAPQPDNVTLIQSPHP